MFYRQKEFLRLRLAVVDMVVTVFAFLAAYVLREHFTVLRLFYLERSNFAGLLLCILAIWLLSGLAVGVYRTPDLFDARRITRDTIRQTVIGAAVLAVFLYLVKMNDVSRTFMLLFVTIDLLLRFFWRLTAPVLVRPAAGAASRRHYVIVGTGEDATAIAHMIENDRAGSAEVVAFIRNGDEEDAGFSSVAAATDNLSRVREVHELVSMLRERVVDEVIFTAGNRKNGELQKLFLICEEEGIKVRLVVNFFPGMVSKVSLDKLNDLPLLTFSSTPDDDYLLFVKRLFDITVGASMAILFAPASLIVMSIIRLSSKGPIFFMQERCGLNGRPFRLYKFRSMYEDAEARRAQVTSLNEMDGPVFKCANDPRITPFGRFIRKFSIDEWPQLINVIKGDMSLVGPRPPLREEVEQYKQWQRRRLRMKPGLTCLWVLEGRNNLDFVSWMRLDMRYIDDWSLGLDCRILLLSIPHVLSGKGL